MAPRQAKTLPADAVESALERRAPRVSIIVPCYNTSQYVGETLDSIAGQTYRDYEVLVVNDGAPDTVALESALAPFSAMITYIAQENRGLAGARNTGIRAARGEYVALLDSDDYWHPQYLEKLVAELDRSPEVDIVFPDAMNFGDSPEAGTSMLQLMPFEGDISFERLLARECFVFVGVLARSETIRAAGLFDESLRSSEDFELWLRVLNRGGRICCLREVLAYYRRRGDSLSANLDQMFAHHHKVWDKVERTMVLSERELHLLAAQRARTEAERRLERGRAAFFRKEFRSARADIAAANKTFRSTKLRLVLILLAAVPSLLLRAYHVRQRLTTRPTQRNEG